MGFQKLQIFFSMVGFTLGCGVSNLLNAQVTNKVLMVSSNYAVRLLNDLFPSFKYFHVTMLLFIGVIICLG